jgi:fibronectin-binding autotransporter adhesin
VRKKAICCAAVSLLALDHFAVNSGAALLTWDPTGAVTPTGGSGNWNLTATNKVWLNPSAVLVPWTDPASANTAIFPAMTSPPATVSLTDNLNVDSISLMGDGYTISSATDTLTLAAATPPSKILVTAAATGTLAMPLAGNNFSKSGAGTLVLTGAANTYTGLTTVTGGTVVGDVDSFGAGSIAISPISATPAVTLSLTGGTFSNNSGVATTSLGASTINSVSTVNPTVMTGTVALGGSLTLSAVSGGTLGISGRIVGAGPLMINTAGPVAIVPVGVTNSFSGGTQIQQGTLYIQRAAGATVLGTGSVQVSSGAMLESGNATIESDLTVASGGTLSLIQSTGTAPGDLTVNSDTMEGAAFDVLAQGNGDGTRTLMAYSQLISNGNVDVTGATLNVSTIAYTPRIGDILYIVDLTNPASSVTGTFAGLPGGKIFPVSVPGDGTAYFRIDYQADFEGGSLTGGNDIAIYVVPEPTTAATLGLLAALAARRRARRI